MEPAPVNCGGLGPAIQLNGFRNCWAIVALIILMLLPVGVADAYMAMRVGLSSNLLIRDERVYFVQSDDGITALGLATGALIARKTDRVYSGRLTSHELGVICDGREVVSLLNPDTLDTIWHVETGYPTLLTNARCLTILEGGLRCVDLETGGIVWSQAIRGGSDFIIVGGYVFVTSADDPYSSSPQGIQIFDLASGEVLWDHTFPDDVCFIQGYFDGEHIYTLSRSVEPDDEDSAPDPYQLFSCAPDKLTTWDLTGAVIETAAAPVSEDTYYGYGYGGEFIHNEMKFGHDGRVEPVDEEADAQLSAGTHEFEAGTVNFKNIGEPLESGQAVALAWESDLRNWQGYVPYIQRYEHLTDIQVHSDRLVWGTDHGVVECIDTPSGQSRWLYVFPSHLATLSYSSCGGMPPHLTSLRAEFIRDNRMEDKALPMIRLPTGFDFNNATAETLNSLTANRTSRVHYDPDPYDPYDWIPPFVLAVWGVFSFSAILAACLIYAYGRRRRNELAIAAGLACVAWLPVAALYWLGRVSLPATICLKLLLLCMAALSVIYLWLAIKKKRTVARVISGVVILVMLLGVGHYALPALRCA